MGDGGGIRGGTTDTVYEYRSSGGFDIFFQIEDENGCKDYILKRGLP